MASLVVRPRTRTSYWPFVAIAALVAVALFVRPGTQHLCNCPTSTAAPPGSETQASLKCPELKCEPCTGDVLDEESEADPINIAPVKSIADPKRFTFVKLPASQTASLLAERKTWDASKWEAEAIRLMKKNKIHQYNIIAAANIGHLNFTLNWIASLKMNGFEKFVVYCFDYQLYSVLVENGFHENAVISPLTWSKYEIPATEHKWMELNYNRLTEAKTRIQYALLMLNYWILFCDVDLVFTSPHVLSHIQYIVGPYCHPVNAPTQCFTVSYNDLTHVSTSTNNAMQDFVYMYDQDTDVNTGFFAARPTDVVKEAFSGTIDIMPKYGIDQLAFNYQVRTVMKARYTKAFKGLEKLLYANGMVYFRQRMNEKLGIQPLVVHVNYAEGYEAKRNLLESAGLWYL